MYFPKLSPFPFTQPTRAQKAGLSREQHPIMQRNRNQARDLLGYAKHHAAQGCSVAIYMASEETHTCVRIDASPAGGIFTEAFIMESMLWCMQSLAERLVMPFEEVLKEAGVTDRADFIRYVRNKNGHEMIVSVVRVCVSLVAVLLEPW